MGGDDADTSELDGTPTGVTGGTSGGGYATSSGGVASGMGGAAQATTGGLGGTGGSAVPGTGGAAAAPYVEPADPLDLANLPTSVQTVSLEISTDAIAALDASPFADQDVLATFIDENGTRYVDVEVHYRGAYTLQNLIYEGRPQRNWKIKFPSTQKYRNRREWNFNYDVSIKQKLVYDLMHFAGVKVPSPRHVRFMVNGELMGPYLEYEDPDSKDWLVDVFGDDTGDLYKAATDVPGEEPCFATLEVLGTADADYFCHYDKKLNNDGLKATDYSRLRTFIDALNNTPDAGFEAFIEASFDVDRLLDYLVVWNYVGHWDGYPQRPKNFWLYEVPAAAHWVLIPWDFNDTFQLGGYFMNTMHASASVLHQLDGFSEYGGVGGEGSERPLVRRTLAIARFRQAYLARYREALGSFLEPQYLAARADALDALVRSVASGDEAGTLDDSTAEVKEFITERDPLVRAELDSLGAP